MSSRQKQRSKSEVLALETIFGPPPILPGEDTSAYDALLRRVSADVKPTDIIEKIWVRDIVDHTWEIFRWRRLVVSLAPEPPPTSLINELHRIERIDRLITVAESRRNAVLREIERRRSTFARTLRDEVHKVEDVEFDVIEPKSISKKIDAGDKAA